MINKNLKTIAVDLTPILPGGENGGAKLFSIELIKKLSEHHPEVTFILLTRQLSNDELSILDNHNIHRIAILADSPKNSSKIHKNLKFSLIKPYIPARLKSVYRSIRPLLLKRRTQNVKKSLLHTIGADLLFCPFTAPNYFEENIPTVSIIYDLQYKSYPFFFTEADAAHRDNTFTDAVKKASKLVAISDYSRYSAILHGKLDPECIRTVHLRMAHRIRLPEDTDNNILQKLNLVQGRYLIYPANFWLHKNHEMLLTGFAMACRLGLPDDISLICTGAPSERQEWLIKSTRVMGLQNRIIFPGYLPDIELGRLMAKSAGMIFPSLYEGFGLPIVEAMAAGVAVACSNTTSLLEIAADAAILFDPRRPDETATAIISLATDETLKIKHILVGEARAEAFADTDRMAREYWEIFQCAVNDHKMENLLAGVYEDGWIGPKLTVQTADASSDRCLEFDFFAPDFLPTRSIQVKIYSLEQNFDKIIHLKRGSSTTYSIPLEHQGDRYDLTISPSFIPSNHNIGPDTRELCLILRSCRIHDANGSVIHLFAQESSDDSMRQYS